MKQVHYIVYQVKKYNIMFYFFITQLKDQHLVQYTGCTLKMLCVKVISRQ